MTEFKEIEEINVALFRWSLRPAVEGKTAKNTKYWILPERSCIHPQFHTSTHSPIRPLTHPPTHPCTHPPFHRASVCSACSCHQSTRYQRHESGAPAQAPETTVCHGELADAPPRPRRDAGLVADAPPRPGDDAGLVSVARDGLGDLAVGSGEEGNAWQTYPPRVRDVILLLREGLRADG